MVPPASCSSRTKSELWSPYCLSYNLATRSPRTPYSEALRNFSEEATVLSIDVVQQAAKEGCTVEVYFKRAMKWKYGQTHNTYIDRLMFSNSGVVPSYVAAYTDHLSREEQLRAEEETTDDE
jgi:hypothetical protein